MRFFCRVLLVCLIGHAAPALAGTTEPTADRTSISGGLDLVRSRLIIPAFPPPNQLDADWQREYDAARSKRSRGRALVLIGAGVTGLGVVMIATKTGVTENCDLFFCTVNYTLPAYITAGGAGVFAWGIIQERDAARTIRDLEAQRPPGVQTASFVVRGTAFTVGATRVAVHRSLSW